MTVLIISDDAEFSRNVMARWQTERSVPEFAVMSCTVFQEQRPGASRPRTSGAPPEKRECTNGIAGEFDVAILAPAPAEHLLPLLQALETNQAPVIAVVAETALVYRLREEFPRVLTLRHHEGWLDTTVLLTTEVLRRVEATARANAAEHAATAAKRQATLGRFMLEMRHNLNNALTSVLGNAELLLLEPGTLSAETREQITTIHSMSMRMHEIMHRFSSLDAELQFAEKHSQHETQDEDSTFHRTLTSLRVMSATDCK
jgi:signal transduction histidine kinase